MQCIRFWYCLQYRIQHQCSCCIISEHSLCAICALELWSIGLWRFYTEERCFRMSRNKVKAAPDPRGLNNENRISVLLNLTISSSVLLSLYQNSIFNNSSKCMCKYFSFNHCSWFKSKAQFYFNLLPYSYLKRVFYGMF